MARYRADKASIDPTETEDERRERLAELESRLKEGQHYPDYERKLYLIENCIYGVDIQPIATQISKLRFFISLLCDQLRSSYDPDAENFGLLSLPNLEAKFVCANTLISLPNLEDEFSYDEKVVELRVALQENRHKIFRARSTKTKDKYKRRDLEIRDAIRQTVKDSLSKPDEVMIAKCREKIEDAKERRKKVAEPDWYEENVKVQADLFSAFESKRVRKDRNEPERGKIDAEIQWAEKKIRDELAKSDKSNVSSAARYADMIAGWDPYDQNASSSFFDPEWMFNIKDGFDVVIGNPPYVQLQADGGKIAELYADKGFETFDRKGDVYCLFYERGHKLLTGNGCLCFITSNKWMRNEYGRTLRKYLREKSDCRLLIDFAGMQLFNEATVETNILILGSRNQGACNPQVSSIACINETLPATIESQKTQVIFDDDSCWTIVSPEEAMVMAKIDDRGKPIKEWDLKINYGIKTGLNDAFVIDGETRSRLISESPRSEAIIGKILRGRDVRKYSSVFADKWLVATHNGYDRHSRVDVANYPSVKKWLASFEPKLSKRYDQGDTPFNLRACDYWDDFRREKIVWIELSDKAKFTIWDGYILDTCSFIVGSSLRYVLGLLNSRLAAWYFGYIGTKSGMGTLRWKKFMIEQLPLFVPSLQQEQSVVTLVDRILAAKKADPVADTSGLEAEIDQLVYKLYGLTDEEIAVVEGRGESNVKSEEPRTVRASAKGRNATVPETPTDDEEMLE